MILKGYNLEDKNIKYVKLPTGNWEINGELFINNNYNTVDYQLNSFDNIFKIENKRILESVKVGDIIYKGEEFLKLKESFNIYQDEDGDFEDLDKEYEYKKLTKNAIYNYIDVFNSREPIEVAVNLVTFDSGNSFIKPKFENTDVTGLFIYYRNSAFIKIADEVFKSIDFKFEGKLDYSQTKNKKIYGNSFNDGIRFLVAFGTYIFDNNYQNPSNYCDTLENCKSKYKEDYNKIKTVIMTHYNLNYTDIKVNEHIINIKDKFDKIQDYVYKLDYKTKDRDTHRYLVNVLKETSTLITNIINHKENELHQ